MTFYQPDEQYDEEPTIADRKNPVGEMIRNITANTVDKLNRGDIRYQRERATLLRHIGIARELGDLRLLALLKMTLGLVENYIGNFSEAGARWVDAQATFAASNDRAGMAQCQTYLGMMYVHLNRFDSAMDTFAKARKLGEDAGNVAAIVSAETKMGDVWLAKGELLKARICYSLVISVTEDVTWDYVEIIVQALRGLAEVFLASGKINKAWHKAREAHELAMGRGLPIEVGKIGFTMSHIATKADLPAHTAGADEYFAQALETLRGFGSPIWLARVLMDEAWYLHRHEDVGKATDLALEARDIFVQLDMPREVELVDTFLLFG